MTIQQMLRNGDIPQIGFGPGIAGYSDKMKKQRKGLSLFINKVMDKFIYRPLLKRNYINSVADAFKLGYRLLDYSSAYGDGQLIGEAIKRSGVDRGVVANKFMLNTIRKVCTLPKEKFYINLEETGNTVSSTVMIALKDNINKGSIHSGMSVMISGFGVGLSWGGTILKF